MGRCSLALGVAIGAGVSAALVALWPRLRRRKRVFVSGCFDLLHSGHVAFFREAARLGELYVSVGNDANVTQLKAAPMFPEGERVYMVSSIRWVTHAFVAKGMGHDQAPDLDFVQPDIYFVNEDGDKQIKRQQCAERGIEYVVAERVPDSGLTERSSTSIKAALK
jgi:cytidyltransferase-like protein